jgi:hypothetical protein
MNLFKNIKMYLQQPSVKWLCRIAMAGFSGLICTVTAFADSSPQENASVFGAVPTLARIWPTNNNVGVSEICHGLLFYGLGPADLPSYHSGNSMLQALTDEDTAFQTFGKSPFIRTRNGLRYFLHDDPVLPFSEGEVHRDQCLATFASLYMPLSTPIRLHSGSYSISSLLSESVANFVLDQQEPAWTAISYARYLPPKKQWANRFGEQFSFAQLADHLMQIDFNRQSCAGTHIFEALIAIDNADNAYGVLDTGIRRKLNVCLNDLVRQIVERQHEDGSWNKQWCNAMKDNDSGPMTSFQYRVLVTGHILEALNLLGLQKRPSSVVYSRAAEWLKASLYSPEIHSGPFLICTFTHAARSAREVLEKPQANK